MKRQVFHKWSWLFVALLLAFLTCAPALPAQAQSAAGLEVKFAGVIQAVPAAPGYPTGVWRVAGREITVNASTRILPRAAAATAGMWADVTAKRGANGALTAQVVTVMPAEIRIKGPIGARPADPKGLGEWTIAGLKITANADTKISQRGSPLAVDKWAEVFATKTGAGLVALRIRGIEHQEDVDIFGAIESFSATQWILSGIPLTVVTGTLILGAPAVDLLAQAGATLQEDGSLLALRLKVSAKEPEGQRQPVAFDGTVEALPAQGLVGQWTISGKQVTVSAATAINQAKGLAVVGAKVHVIGWQAGDRITATLIVVLESPAPSGKFVRFSGPIQKLPSGDLIGEWQVADRKVLVTEKTRLAAARYAKIGAIAEIGGIQGTDGVVTAAWVKLAPKPDPR
ncbi:MAG: hypothetical protein QG637_269 [Chloroflexota bacterium]|nr:hypothetical protein [Chloroflexota bacterium]